MTHDNLKVTLVADVKCNVRIVDASKPTIEDYIREGLAAGCYDFRLVPRFLPDGTIVAYLHPLNRNGKTQDFKFQGDVVETIFETGTFK